MSNGETVKVSNGLDDGEFRHASGGDGEADGDGVPNEDE